MKIFRRSTPRKFRDIYFHGIFQISIFSPKIPGNFQNVLEIPRKIYENSIEIQAGIFEKQLKFRGNFSLNFRRKFRNVKKYVMIRSKRKKKKMKAANDKNLLHSENMEIFSKILV